ncbi:MAG: carboxypeptidase regulatory-like domain-containing protein, partial [Anaerolineae bacterium]|nr:carboxypeptidase regulatory-like domain-containing protein [Anaerolineae bacterium]
QDSASATDTTDSDADIATGQTITTTLIPGENDTSWDAGLYQFASIGDRVWNDVNDNGIQDGGETGIQNVSVTLYNGSGVQVGSATTTDANGNYSFTNLIPGDYYVVFTLPTGYAFSRLDQGADDTADSDANRTTGRTITTTLTSGENDLTWDAGVMELSSIGDRVWDDANDNGLQDGGESGFSNVTVTLYDGTGTQVGTPTTTDANGNYSFTNLVPGDYYIEFTLPSGYVFSRLDQGGDDTADSDVNRTTGRTITTTLIPGEDDMSWDAGIMQVASIGDRVWDDANDNGLQDGGESGVQNVTVTLYDGTGTQVGSATTTNASGNYSFTNLVPGDYYVVFTLPSGYAFSRLDQGGDDTTDSDANRTTGRTVTTTLIPGENDTSWDAGIMLLASIGDRVWNDANDNGVQDGGETGVQNVTVTLYDGTGTQVGSPTTTNSTGNYSFTNLVPGDYYVVFTLPTGYAFSRLDQGGNDTTDSDADRSTGQAITTTLIPGENDTSWDAGIMLLASIGDRVWHDDNDNGVQDGGESGVQNVTVTLYDGTGTQVGSPTMTNASGNYSFTNLVPGDYYVVFTLPTGYVFSRQDQGGNDATDSDADRSTGQAITTTLIPGENDTSWDAGIMLLASIGDRVWHDDNDNGVQDGGENGVQNVTVTLYDGTGTQVGSATTTDANGNYSFTNLVPGDYYVVFTLPTGYAFSRQDQGGNDTADSDADRSTGQTITTTLLADEDDLSWDAGIMLLSSIGDRVWLDVNANGVQDVSETTGIANVTVTLYDGTGTQVGSATTTDASGNYSFVNLVPGDYYVVFTLPSGYNFSPQDSASGTEATDSDANPTTGRAATTTLLPDEDDLSWDAGLYQYASLGDRVWEDLNADGIQDAGEPGVSGVTVTLRNVSTGTDTSTTTDSNGNYRFENLIPGDYYVTFTRPTGFLFTLIDQGGDDAADSDANVTTGQTTTTTLISGENDLSWDAGLYRTTALGDVVWEDMNANGVQDAGEPGVAGVTVNLYDGTNTLVDTQVTDANGGYLFVDLTPDNYTIEFILPTGYLFSPLDAGGNDATDSDADRTTGRTVTTTLISNEVDLTWDAGLYRLGSLGDYVWEDLNANGLQDVGERALANVNVSLYDGAGNLLATTLTDVDGLYLFDDLTPGQYQVAFELLNGYAFTFEASGADNTVDSNANRSTGRTPIIDLPSNADDMTWDAGMLILGSLGDFVWEDLNYNGLQDPGELGVQGVTVSLYGGGGNLIRTTTTNGSGKYLFDLLAAGDYYVEFTLPDGYGFSPVDEGADNAIDSDAEIEDGSIIGKTAVTFLNWGQTDLTWDAGIVRLGSLGDRVWLDNNRNRQQDSGEAGIPNVTLIIDWFNGKQQTTETGNNGIYLFDELPPGEYRVMVALDTLPAGLNATYDLDGNLDSIATVRLGAAEHIDTVDFGYARPVLADGTGTWVAPGVCARMCVDWTLYHTDQTGDWEIFRLDNRNGEMVSVNLSQGEDAEDMAPTRSPNAEWIVFSSNRDGNWELYLAPTNGDGSQIRRLTYNNVAVDTDPVWGPNNFVVFETTRNGNWDLYLMDMTTGKLTQLTDSEANDINAFWSPNGQKLVFQSDRSGKWQIYELDLRTLGVKRVSDGRGVDLDPAYNNAGDTIAFRSYREGNQSVIYTMTAEGRNIRAISDVAGDATNHSWSPDDSLIAYQSDLDGDLDVYVYGMNNGRTRKLTDNTIPDYAPTWQCGTLKVIFTSDVNGNPDIYDADALPINAPSLVVETEARQLTTDEGNDIYPVGAPLEENASREGQLPDVSEGLGEQSVFLQPDASTTVADQSSEDSQIWEPVSSCVTECVSWSVYQSNQSGRWNIYRLGEQAGNISRGQGDDLEPSRSPDTKWIAFSSNRDGNREIYIGSTDGRRQQRVTNNAAEDVDPVWSPNSQYIVYESNRNGNWDLYLLDVFTGVETRLTQDAADDVNAAWSSAGGSIVFQSNRSGLWQVYRLDLRTGVVTRLTNLSENALDPLFAPSGSLIAFRVEREGKSVLYLMQEDGSEPVAISDPAGNAMNQSWYYDDSLIAYQSDLDGDTDIYVYGVQSGETRKLTENAIPDYAPTWQCGEAVVVFTSDVTGDANIFEAPALPLEAVGIDVQAEATQLTRGRADDRFPVGTPSEENASRAGDE